MNEKNIASPSTCEMCGQSLAQDETQGHDVHDVLRRIAAWMADDAISCQCAIMSAFNAGLTQHDIATKLGVDQSNVSRAIARARRQFPGLLPARSRQGVGAKANSTK